MKTTRLFSVILAALMLISVFPLSAGAYSKEQATLTFTSDGITETASGSGYTIDGTSLTITSDGTYRITGSCTEGKLEVAKSLSNVTLILDNLTLSNSDTAPIIVKKSSSVLMKLVGTSTITNNEEASKETTDPDNFEGAAIKVKSDSALTIFGDGTLNAVGNAKNAIKGGAESSLKVDGGTIKATAINNGIGFDGSIVINAGSFDVTAGNDGIKSEPDEGDTASAGTVTINGGTFNINSQGDGIVAAEKLTINNGEFTIKTLNGYNSSSFNKDTMSCKGLKASSNNVADADNPTTSIEITGGSFNLNTADDAIHSDGYVTITGGTFNIYTGDDGVHADVTLTLGTENGYERDPEITINSSYEGLEGAAVNIYSGKYYVIASDDGINAAGGSSNGTDPAQGGNDSFTPPQGGQGGPGQGGPGQGGFNPGGQQSSGNSNYSINVYGGSIYVNCLGDGLDSNGALNLLGGDITVLSMQSGGDNSPLDADGTVTINGATVFAAGSRGMGVNLSASSQSAYTSSSSYNANTVVNVTSSGTVLRSEKLVRNINYLLYSEPNLGNCSVSTSSSVNSCKSNAFAHNWDSGTTENGVITYTCSDCNKTERKSVANSATITEYVEEEAATSETTSATSESEATSETNAATSENAASSETTQTTEQTEGNQTTIKLSAAKKTIYVNNSTTVKAIVTNKNGATTFTSSDNSIAAVNSKGKVTAKKAGTVTIKATNNGKTASVKIKVVKKANTMTVKGRTVTAKAKQKTAFNVSKILTVKKAQGTVVYKKLSGNSKISINAKTGKLTVKKGLKKGKTYSVKIRVTAKGNSTYKSKSKTVTVKIKVK